MKIKNLTLSSILVALTIIILALNMILPISTLSLLTIASVFIPVAIIKTTIKNSLMVYAASSLLGLLLLQKDVVILYIIFFGIYGLIKFLIEKLSNIYYEIPLKLVFANIILVIYYLIFKSFVNLTTADLPIYLIFIGANVVFLIYDYALTMLIGIYMEKFNNRV